VSSWANRPAAFALQVMLDVIAVSQRGTRPLLTQIFDGADPPKSLDKYSLDHKEPRIFRAFASMKSTLVQRFIRASWTQRLLWLEASLCLIAACVVVQCVPFSRWKWTLGTIHPPAAEVHFRALDCLDHGVVGNVGLALEMAARKLPWQSVCLPQAVAARWMLARRGYIVEVYFGSRRAEQADEPPHLHAWAVVGDLCITGASEVTTFTPMVRYFSGR